MLDGRLAPQTQPWQQLIWQQLPAPDYVVAADGGARHAHSLGLSVDAWVGDFDSSQGLTCTAPQQKHPRDKDQTDGELANQLALKQGARQLVLVGAFGGRFDHASANALAALQLSQQQPELTICLTSGDEWGWPLTEGQKLALTLPDVTLSILPYSQLVGLSLSGVKWPLTRAEVPLGSSLTISNRSQGSLEQPQTVRSSLEQGYALLTVCH